MESLRRGNLVGREFVLNTGGDGTLVFVTSKIGYNYRVKNLAAGHTTNYDTKDFYKMVAYETRKSIINRYFESNTRV